MVPLFEDYFPYFSQPSAGCSVFTGTTNAPYLPNEGFGKDSNDPLCIPHICVVLWNKQHSCNFIYNEISGTVDFF